MIIKNRLILTFTIINLIVFTVVTAVITVNTSKSMKTTLLEQLDNTAEFVSQQVTSAISNSADEYIRSTADNLLNSIEAAYDSVDEEVAQEYFINLFKNTRIADSGYIYATRSDGTIIYHPVEKTGDKMSVLSSWVKDNQFKNKLVLDYTYKNREKKLIKVYFKKWDWQVMVTVYVDEFKELLNMETLNRQISSIKVGEHGYPIITNAKGLLLTHKNQNKIGVNITKLKNAKGELFLENFMDFDENSYNYNWLEPDGSVRYKYLHYIKEPSTGWYIIVTAYWDEFDEDLNRIKTILIWASILAMIVNILFVLLSTRSIVKPINDLTNLIKEISEGDGDLTRKITIRRKDETGLMAGFLNTFVSNLNKMMGDIKKSTDHTLSAKDDLFAVSEETSASICQITKNIDHISDKISHLDTNVCLSTDSVNEITGNITGLNSSIESQNAMIEESTAAITEMIASISSVAAITERKQISVQNLVDTAKEGGNVIESTQNSVEKVKSQLENINEMTNIISSIAARTNLLAMNAAIEAAHAGDAGKGFAVVASEIRNLAESSSRSSSKIKETIKNVSQSINETSTLSEKTGSSFRSIDGEIKEVVLALNEIVSSTGELQIGGQELLASINSLRDISTDVRENSVSIKESVDNVNQAMENTSAITYEVVTAIKEVTLGTNEIQKSMGHVTDNIQVISETGVLLSDNVNKFKIEV